MNPPLISVSIITRDRTDELAAVLASIGMQDLEDYEILIGDNGSTPENLAVIKSIVAQHPKARLSSFEQNLGVAGGRTALLEQCRGQYILEVDDDGILGRPTVFRHAVNEFNKAADIGILAFRVVNFHTRTVDRHEYPFLNKRRDSTVRGEATWFIGCGHFFRRELIDRIGGYRDFFPYGAEELDFALRAMNAGYRIVYEPQLEVLHKKSLKHRIVDPVQWGALSFKQRMKAVTLNLPMPFWISSFLIRGFLYSGKLRYPSVIPKGLAMLRADWDYIRSHRKPVRWQTIWRIFRLRGPLFF
jgi:GT2 family glycosyltransferase